MKLEDFNLLSDEDKTTFLASIESNEKTISDLTAERDSFKTENEQLTAEIEKSNKELKATKELNFTMARKINTGSKDDPETALYKFMKGM